MNSDSSFCRHKVSRRSRHTKSMLALFLGFVILGVCPSAERTSAQDGGEPAAEFKKLAAELSNARLAGGEENEGRMEKALAYLDSVAVAFLNASAGPNLDEPNRILAGLASHTPPVGENYRLVKLGGTPAVYAMVINFGLGGPAAVRIYGGATGHYAFAARVDRFAQTDFLDSDIEAVSVSDAEPAFVTISGRTDDLATGAFMAWHFDGHGLVPLWSSDLLQQSSYDAGKDGFHLAYCSQVDEDHPSECHKMSRDLYRYAGGEWKRVESAELPTPKAAAK